MAIVYPDFGTVLTVAGANITSSYTTGDIVVPPLYLPRRAVLWVNMTYAGLSVLTGITVGLKARYGSDEQAFSYLFTINQEDGTSASEQDIPKAGPNSLTSRTVAIETASSFAAKGGYRVQLKSRDAAVGIAGDSMSVALVFLP